MWQINREYKIFLRLTEVISGLGFPLTFKFQSQCNIKKEKKYIDTKLCVVVPMRMQLEQLEEGSTRWSLKIVKTLDAKYVPVS